MSRTAPARLQSRKRATDPRSARDTAGRLKIQSPETATDFHVIARRKLNTRGAPSGAARHSRSHRALGTIVEQVRQPELQLIELAALSQFSLYPRHFAIECFTRASRCDVLPLPLPADRLHGRCAQRAADRFDCQCGDAPRGGQRRQIQRETRRARCGPRFGSEAQDLDQSCRTYVLLVFLLPGSAGAIRAASAQALRRCGFQARGTGRNRCAPAVPRRCVHRTNASHVRIAITVHSPDPSSAWWRMRSVSGPQAYQLLTISARFSKAGKTIALGRQAMKTIASARASSPSGCRAGLGCQASSATPAPADQPGHVLVAMRNTRRAM